MGTLDNVMEFMKLKKYEEAQAANNTQTAINTFAEVLQNKRKNDLEMLTARILAAKSGFDINPDGSLRVNSEFNSNDQLDQMLKVSQIQKNQQMTQTSKSRSDMLDQILNGQGETVKSPDDILAEAAKNTGYGTEDFVIKPVNKMVAGVPHTAYLPELKKPLPTSLENEYKGFINTELGLQQNLRMLKEHPEIEKEMSVTNPKAHRGGTLFGNIGQFVLKIDPNSKDFATFKAETDKVFQQFRKETTGAQAALKELGWLSPDYPETTDNPELYKTKANEAIRRIQEGKQLLLDNWSQNYRTSQLKKVDSPTERVEKNTRKVGRFTIMEE